MGFVQAYSACVSCKQPFFYNPMRVPSVVLNGKREPICRDCVERANPKRIEKGLDPIEILPGAYEPCDESELADD